MIFRFNLIERLLLRFNIIPHPLMDSMVNVVAGRALQAGVRLGIFDILEGNKPKSLSEVAKECNVKEVGAKVLLDCFCAMGYLENDGSNYKLSKRGVRFLIKSSPYSVRNVILFDAHFTFPRLLHLEENIKRGGPSELPQVDKITEGERSVFVGAMLDIAKQNAAEVTKLAPLQKEALKLIDLGGMHSYYAVEYCKKYPNLIANVVDGASLKSYAEQVIAEHSMQDRVKFIGGDFFTDKIGENYDTALIFSVVHVLPEEKNRQLAKLVYQLLNSGGQVIIMDQIKDTAPKSEFAKFFVASLGVMLCNNTGGRTYSFEEIKKWLDGAGFKNCRLKKMKTPGFGIVIAEK